MMALARSPLYCIACMAALFPGAPCAAQGWFPWTSDTYQSAPRQSETRKPPKRKPRPANAVQDGGSRPEIMPQEPSIVAFPHNFAVNSIVIDTSRRKLYFVLQENRAYEYPISVGRKGFSWTGTETVTHKRAWPDWYPPAEMRERDARLPKKMTGGVRNPLGAIALYLGETEYRIHGTNDVKSIGRAQSSGCFRMHNPQVLHLASLVEIGTMVVVADSLPTSQDASRPAGDLSKVRKGEQSRSRRHLSRARGQED